VKIEGKNQGYYVFNRSITRSLAYVILNLPVGRQVYFRILQINKISQQGQILKQVQDD